PALCTFLSFEQVGTNHHHCWRKMELRRLKDILAVKAADGSLVAFHARNLEVAQISEEAWRDLQVFDGMEPSESLQELKSWEAEESSQVQTSKLDFGIRFLTLNVTQICNLHCHYCAAGGDGTFGDAVAKISIEKTLPQIKYFLS